MSLMDELTAGELATAENRAGVSITSLEDPNAPKLGLLTALAWVALKRENPQAKYKDAEDMKLPEITALLGLDGEEEDPKEQ